MANKKGKSFLGGHAVSVALYTTRKKSEHDIEEADNWLPLQAAKHLEDPRNFEQEIDDKLDLTEIISRIGDLSPKRKEILSLYYFEGHTLEEIAGQINVTDEQVRQIKNEALREVRKSMKISSNER